MASPSTCDRAVTIAAASLVWSLRAEDDGARQTIDFLAAAMAGTAEAPHATEAAGSVRVVCDDAVRTPYCLTSGWPWPAAAGGLVVRLPAVDGTINATPLTNAMLLAAALARCQPRGGLYHGALVVRDGQALLLAAPGGTGKSTACLRLPDDWQVLSDDTALVLPDDRGVPWASPWPTWSRFHDGGPGGQWAADQRVPLRGVCFLEQAERDEVAPVGRGETAIRLYAAAEQARSLALRGLPADEQRQHRRRWFDDAAELAGRLFGCRLRLTLHGSFWELLDPLLGAPRESCER